MLLTVLAAFAQEESRSISENLKWGLRKRYESGIGRWTPVYGYRKAGDGGIVVEPKEGETIRMMFRWYADGCSIREICSKLNAQEILSPRGKKWSPGSVHTILRNEKYVGDLRLQKWIAVDHISHKCVRNEFTQSPGYYVRDCHTPIVDRATFELVQELLNIHALNCEIMQISPGGSEPGVCEPEPIQPSRREPEREVSGR